MTSLSEPEPIKRHETKGRFQIIPRAPQSTLYLLWVKDQFCFLMFSPLCLYKSKMTTKIRPNVQQKEYGKIKMTLAQMLSKTR